MALSPEKVKELETIIAQNLGLETFTFADFIENPGDYGATIYDADLIQMYLEQEAPNEKITGFFDNVKINAINSDMPSISYDSNGNIIIGSNIPSENKRQVVVKDASGNAVLDENGNFKTVEIDLEKGIFPAENFVETFTQTLNQSDVIKIQEFAIEMGYLDEEDLGSEVNGNMGIVTENFIYQVLDYANKEYDDWYEGSTKRNVFVTDEADARNKSEMSYNVNSFFGGVDYRKNQLNENQILSREIFANVLEDFLLKQKSLSEGQQAKMDKAQAAKIRAANIKPDRLSLEQEFDNYWLSLTGDKLSDSRKADLALEVMRNWNPYVEALIAQDKSLRAGEVMNKFTGTQAWEKMGFDQPQMGGYVTFEEIKPEFLVEDPRQAAIESLQTQSQKQSELSDEANLIAETQAEYLKFLMGGK